MAHHRRSLGRGEQLRSFKCWPRIPQPKDVGQPIAADCISRPRLLRCGMIRQPCLPPPAPHLINLGKQKLVDAIDQLRRQRIRRKVCPWFKGNRPRQLLGWIDSKRHGSRCQPAENDRQPTSAFHHRDACRLSMREAMGNQIRSGITGNPSRAESSRWRRGPRPPIPRYGRARASIPVRD